MTKCVIALLVFVPMLVEARRAARNERAQRARGGVEPPDDVYAVMTLAYPGAFLAMLAEGLARETPRTTVFSAGLLLFALSKALKWWAIETLGPFWTFKVIVVPGATLVAAGPYRFLKHPNYLAVVGELVGVAAMANAPIAGPIATLAFCVLLVKRMAVEERALRGDPSAILPPR